MKNIICYLWLCFLIGIATPVLATGINQDDLNAELDNALKNLLSSAAEFTIDTMIDHHLDALDQLSQHYDDLSKQEAGKFGAGNSIDDPVARKKLQSKFATKAQYYGRKGAEVRAQTPRAALQAVYEDENFNCITDETAAIIDTALEGDK